MFSYHILCCRSLLIEPAFRSESPAKPKDDAAEPEEATVEQSKYLMPVSQLGSRI